MKIFTTDKIRAADAYTIEHEPVTSIMLMERAAGQLAEWITKKISRETNLKIFVGPGNNGGDGWALARLLIKREFLNLEVYFLKITDHLSHDAETNRKRLIKESKVTVKTIQSKKDFPEIGKNDYLIDALFGSGLSRPLDGLAAELVIYLNQSINNGIIAIDIPSGLNAEDNSKNLKESIIKAKYTLTFQFPKIAFLFAENVQFVGDSTVLPIGIHQDFIKNEPSAFNFTQEEEVIKIIRIRDKFSHKGTYGHALLIAGSYGMMGAAVLAVKASLRAGAGLVTVHVPKLGVDIMQISVPESLLNIDKSDTYFTMYPEISKYTAVGIGPGLGLAADSKKIFEILLSEVKVPLVIDADALNMLSLITNWRDILPENCILTPHPKEFERLFGKFSDSYTRLSAQINFSVKKKCTIILKGAYSCITTPDGNVWFNSTGNPGMATGGSGDVLTGLILGLLAQGYSLAEAAISGVYIHGLAGDLVTQNKGQHALIASDITDNIGTVFSVLEKKKTTK
jgi:ADP-dependent NAD(P)H-hydrate dehydratase / NAD(P)H-hydrate epimerase